MPSYDVSYHPTTRVATILNDGASKPSGSIDIGSFEHPDPIYPDSVVPYHKVRDLLYHRSAADPSKEAMFPFNITDMDRVEIVLQP